MSLTATQEFRGIIQSLSQGKAYSFVQGLVNTQAYEIDSVKAIIELADFGLFPKSLAKELLRFASQVFYKNPGRAEPTLLCLMCLYLLERDEDVFALCKNIQVPNQKLDVLLAMRQFIQFNYSDEFISKVLSDAPAGVQIPPNLISSKPSLVFNFSCDGVYFRNKFLKFHAGTVITSARTNALIFLALIDPSAEDIADCERLKVLGAFDYLVIDSKLWLTQTTGRVADPMTFLAQQKTIYACMRFLVCHELLASFRCPVVSLDSDLIIKSSLEDFISHSLLITESSDISLQVSERSLPGADHMAHEVLISSSVAGVSFARLLSAYIKYHFQTLKGLWTLDQCALNACLQYLIGLPLSQRPRVRNTLGDPLHRDMVHHLGGGFEHLHNTAPLSPLSLKEQL